MAGCSRCNVQITVSTKYPHLHHIHFPFYSNKMLMRLIMFFCLNNTVSNHSVISTSFHLNKCSCIHINAQCNSERNSVWLGIQSNSAFSQSETNILPNVIIKEVLIRMSGQFAVITLFILLLTFNFFACQDWIIAGTRNK